ncbi:MAG: T9SS type A sorting domain-containing protein [Bacteroidota bacterium]
MKTLAAILVGGLLAQMLFPESTAQGQVILEENFEYTAGTTLISNGWTAQDAEGTNPILVSPAGLTYGGYLSSGIGNAASLGGAGGEDVNRGFSAVSSGSIYVSFMLSISSAKTGGDYFLHLRSGTSQYVRVFVKRDASNSLAFGLAKSTDPPTYTSFNYMLGTTYLLTVKYTVVPLDSNDQVTLFVFTSEVPSVEPASPEVGPLVPANKDASSLASVALRQGSASASPALVIDGIRVGTSWNEVPLPIQLASSHASVVRDNDVEVVWRTISETNNYGFEIERTRVLNGSSDVNPHWVKIAFVQGHGTTLIPQLYSCIDRSVPFGNYSYRIRQIDLDGKSEIFPEMEVSVGVAQDKLILAQNYPNPFNPSTVIEFVVPQAGRATIKVYNLLGQELATLHDGIVQANRIYSTEFNALGLPSGLYFYQLRSAGKIETKRMTLMK